MADYSRSPRAAIIVVIMVMVMMVRMVLIFVVMANIRAKYGSYNNLNTFTMGRVYPFSITALEKLSPLPPFFKETFVLDISFNFDIYLIFWGQVEDRQQLLRSQWF